MSVLRKEVKEAVREKKLSIWNEVVEKVNADFERSLKEEVERSFGLLLVYEQRVSTRTSLR